MRDERLRSVLRLFRGDRPAPTAVTRFGIVNDQKSGTGRAPGAVGVEDVWFSGDGTIERNVRVWSGDFAKLVHLRRQLAVQRVVQQQRPGQRVQTVGARVARG